MVDRTPARTTDTVSAGEHERLRRDHAALNDQYEAAHEVLLAVGRSAGDPDTVLTTIVESARRLCRSHAAHIYLLEDGVFRLIKAVGLSDESIRFIAEHPMPIDRRHSSAGWVWTGPPSRSPTCWPIPTTAPRPPAGGRVPDHHGRADAPRRRGGRRAAGLAQRGEPVRRARDGDRHRVRRPGRHGGQRRQAGPAARRPAGQSSRARSRSSRRCGRSAKRSSSSLDVDDVLATIAMHAVELSGTDGGSIMEYDEPDRSFTVRSVYRTEPEVVEQLRSDPHRPRRDAGRARRAGAAALGGDRPRADRPRSAPAGPPRRRLAIGRGRPDAARGAGSSVHWSCGGSGPATSPRRPSTCSRPSPASRRWRCSTPGCSASSRTQSARARAGQPAQVRVPGEHVPRAANTAQRGAGLLRGAPRADVRRDQRASGGVPARHPRVGQAPAGAAQRDPRPLQGRGRPDAARVLLVRPALAARRHRLDAAGTGRRPRRSTLRVDVADDVGSVVLRRAAAQAGAC